MVTESDWHPLCTRYREWLVNYLSHNNNIMVTAWVSGTIGFMKAETIQNDQIFDSCLKDWSTLQACHTEIKLVDRTQKKV